MTDKNVKPQVDEGTVNPVVAAVAGAVVAGVAVAGAMIMSDKKNQDKVKQVVADKKSVIVDKAQKLETIAKKAVVDVKNI